MLKLKLQYFGHHSLAQVNNGEGTQLHPWRENWIKDLLSVAPPVRIRPSFLLSQSLPWKLSWVSYPPSESRQTKNLNHRKLTNLITWTTALSNSMKLWAMPCRATQDRQVMVESSDKALSTGEGSGKPLQYSCLENPTNSMKRRTLDLHKSETRICLCYLWNSI